MTCCTFPEPRRDRTRSVNIAQRYEREPTRSISSGTKDEQIALQYTHWRPPTKKQIGYEYKQSIFYEIFIIELFSRTVN